MDKDLRQTSCTPGANLTPNPLSKVDDAGPDGEPPALVPEAVIGGVEREDVRVRRVGGVADEASGGMGVETDHEEEREVVRVPEGLEALVADLVVGRGIHEEHDEEHEVAGDAACLVIVNVDRQPWADLCTNKAC